VRAIVRLETDLKKIKLEHLGVHVFQVDTSNKSAISKHCIESPLSSVGTCRFRGNSN
jgi:hypothetical protein